MNFIKKHPYLLFELIGILGAVITFILYMFGVGTAEFAGIIIIFFILDIIISPIVIAIVRTISKSNQKYDKRTEEYKNSDNASYGDEYALKIIKRNSNIVIVIGIIMGIPLLLLTTVFLAGKEWGPFITFLLFTLLASGLPIMLGISYKKHPEKHINQFKTKYVDLSSYKDEGKFTSDKSKWHWDSACEVYCKQFNKNPDTLTDDDIITIWEYARNHIAFFLTWLIENNYYHVEEEYEEKGLKDVKERKRTGGDILAEYDEVLSRFEISSEVIGFVDYYYDKYMEDYANFVKNELGKNVYGIGFSWEDYDKVKKIIDKEYLEFQRN